MIYSENKIFQNSLNLFPNGKILNAIFIKDQQSDISWMATVNSKDYMTPIHTNFKKPGLIIVIRM